MLMPLELAPLILEFLREKNVMVCGVAHPEHFSQGSRSDLPESSYFGEEYQLFWPDQPEFVRMAAKFGAVIVSFGAIGEDDLVEIN
ncbi:hypothetical protein LXL04_002722 [Taraxacum kok-saghyz]